MQSNAFHKILVKLQKKSKKKNAKIYLQQKPSQNKHMKFQRNSLLFGRKYLNKITLHNKKK